MRRCYKISLGALLGALCACGPRGEAPPPGIDSIQHALSTIDCTQSQSTGYKSGQSFAIVVVHVDGEPVQVDTANAYYVMAEAAAAAGVNIKVVSGFRTYEEQQWLYRCYINKTNCSNCNNCNLAAPPGYSEHNSGHALDLNTAAGGVLDWLNNNAGRFGFKRTVPSEAWHWEWWGGGPGGGPCSCQSRSGPFSWSCAGPVAGQACTQIVETSDPDSWGDNFFCCAVDLGVKWSSAGPISGMRCTPITESAEPAAQAWNDNYLCVPPQLPFDFSWSSAGPTAGASCLLWAEPSEPDTWTDNYLCWTQRSRTANGPFTWSSAGPVEGLTCTLLGESSDPDSWSDNHLCASSDLGLKWSSAGPISGMRCTPITEGDEPAAHTWDDNYLCVPSGSPYELRWSSAGPIAGLDCLAWSEPSDPNTWYDNYLCWTFQTPSPDASGPAPDGLRADGGAGDGGAAPDATDADAAEVANGAAHGGCALAPSPAGPAWPWPLALVGLLVTRIARGPVRRPARTSAARRP